MAVTIKTSEGHTYGVKDFDELTLADWRDLTAVDLPDPDESKALENTLALLSRHTGMPVADLRRLRPESADLLIEAIGETLALALRAKDEERELPTTYTLGGITYAVPQNLEADTVAGQWWDFKAAHTLEHEADIMIRSLAVLLVPEGEEYDGNPDARMEAMATMPAQDAFAMSAFFFESSERYRSHTSLLFQAFITSVQHRIGQALPTSATDTK